MKSIAAACLLILTSAIAGAAEMPSRKPGLWDLKMTFDKRPGIQGIQQCIDAATDEMLQSNAGAFASEACGKRDVARVGNVTTIDSICTIRGKSATSHVVITGSFDSAYTMTVTSRGESLSGGGVNITIEAKWLGPCAKDQKPGDVIMPNGMKMNIPEMRSRRPSGIEPGAPTPLPR